MIQEMKMRASARLFRPSHPYQLLHQADLLLILFGTDLLPRHTSAAVRIEAASHGDLRTIENAWTSRQRKQYRKLLIEDIRIVKPVHQPLCVMGNQED